LAVQDFTPGFKTFTGTKKPDTKLVRRVIIILRIKSQ